MPPSLPVPLSPSRLRVAPSPHLPVPPSKTAPFVGRRAERAILDAELQTTAGDRARVVLLTGEIGIGKSRLWQEWSAGLGADVTVLEGRCLEATQGLPFAPLTEPFTHHPRLRELLTPGSPLPPLWLAEVARIFPHLCVSVPNPRPPAVAPPEEERRRVFEALAQVLLALMSSSRPVVLFLDDLHWADRSTLDWLGYLVQRLRTHRLLLVIAYRPEDAPPPLAGLVAGWERDGLARRLPLTRLSNEAAAALIAALGVDPFQAQRMQAQGAGNPLFMIELWRAGSDDVPAVLADLVRARLDRLPDSARQVLQAAAILEPEFDFATLRRSSGRGEEETLDALDALLGTAVLVERDGGYAFAHPLVAHVVRDGLSGARRAFLHRRAAEALEAAHPGHLEQVTGQLAVHYAEAGDSARAARFAELAAERALALAAPEEAIAFYRQAIALEPTPERHMALARVLLRQVDLEGARIAFQAALAGFEATDDRRGIARAYVNLAETYYPAGRFDEARRLMEQGLARLDMDADPEAHVLAHQLLGASLLGGGGSLAEAEAQFAEAARLAEEKGLPKLAARCHFMLGTLYAESGDLARALDAYTTTIALAHTAGDDFQEALGHNNLAYHALLAGDIDLARDHVAAGLALCEARALRLPLQHLYSTRGEIALAEQQWGEAEQWFIRGLAEAERNDNPGAIANYQANLGLAARGRGDLETALGLLESARQSASALPDVHLQIKLDLLLAELLLQRGERVAAGEALGRAEAHLAGAERRGLQAWAQRVRQALVVAATSAS